jgi:2-dehydropantoate 2-reductase
MRIAIMGAGGVGGYVGARLAACGQDVVFIARGTHLAALRARGLQIASALGDLALSPVEASDDPATLGPVELVIFAVKLYDTESAARAARPWSAPPPAWSLCRTASTAWLSWHASSAPGMSSAASPTSRRPSPSRA